ncbi:hypothetical protein D3C75_1045340 [compost metagenome]
MITLVHIQDDPLGVLVQLLHVSILVIVVVHTCRPVVILDGFVPGPHVAGIVQLQVLPISRPSRSCGFLPRLVQIPAGIVHPAVQHSPRIDGDRRRGSRLRLLRCSLYQRQKQG